MNAEIIITWYNGKPIGLWYNDAAIWETKEIISETDLISTTVVLPLAEAASFLTIFINGMAVNNLVELLKVVSTKIAELKKLELKNKDAGNNNNGGHWFSDHPDNYHYNCDL